jgi:hypothetical protein
MERMQRNQEQSRGNDEKKDEVNEKWKEMKKMKRENKT